MNTTTDYSIAGQNTAFDSSFVGLSGLIFHEIMLSHGIKHVFGYPGDMNKEHMTERYERVI
ncbi:6529_t:CDS:2, partial [Funneliformis geosporum]